MALLERVLPRLECHLVVDALASAYLTEHPDGLRHLERPVVLTVNPTELAHTAGTTPTRWPTTPSPAARRVADRARVVVVVAAAPASASSPPGGPWLVRGRRTGLGVSGSGDVQAGIVAGLLARGADPAQAGVWGAYVHARAGERLAADVGPSASWPGSCPARSPPCCPSCTDRRPPRLVTGLASRHAGPAAQAGAFPTGGGRTRR